MDNPKSAAASAPPTESFHVDTDRPLYALEADDFAAAVFDGAAPAISRDDSLANMRILDTMRKQVGVRFD
jgi:predicted dehydrogenase